MSTCVDGCKAAQVCSVCGGNCANRDPLIVDGIVLGHRFTCLQCGNSDIEVM